MLRKIMLTVVVMLVAASCGQSKPVAEPTPSPSESTEASDVCQDATLGFWGLGAPAAEQNWDQGSVRVGYTLSGDALLVVFQDDRVLGSTHVSVRGGQAVTADGDTVELDEELSGQHTLRVVLYQDTNDNDVFDPEKDQPCRSEGALIQAGPRQIDFDRFGDE